MRTSSAQPLHRLSFLLPPPPPGADPLGELDSALELVALGEALGYAGAWVPWRGPDDAVWSAVALLAAATQHTRRIELGAHGVPVDDIGRHDLPAADLLSRGRFQLGLDDLHGTPLPPFPGSDTLVGRVWADAVDADGALRAAAAGRHLFTGSGVDADADAAAVQAGLVQRFAEAAGRVPTSSPPRIAVGRVVLPLDSADEATRDRLRELASRSDSDSDRRVPDLVGASDELIELLAGDPALGAAGELRLELPAGVEASVRAQILHDVAEFVAPELGWHAPSRPPADLTALYI